MRSSFLKTGNPKKFWKNICEGEKSIIELSTNSTKGGTSSSTIEQMYPMGSAEWQMQQTSIL